VDSCGSQETLLRFGVFELDLKTGELRKAGLLLRLPPQPFKILALLAGRPGQLVSREEIQQQIWGSETFVDFELGLNAAIKTIRDTLGDDAETPRYIQTLPRRGYRFICPVNVGAIHELPLPGTLAPVAPASPPATHGDGDIAAAAVGAGLVPAQVRPQGAPLPARISPQITTGGFTRRAVAAVVQGALKAHRARTRWRRLAVAGIAAAVVAVLVGLNVAGLRDRVVGPGLAPARPTQASALPKIQSIAVLPLENLSGDKEQEYFADGMTDELITNLSKIGTLRVTSRTSVMRYKGTQKPLPEIGRELNVDAVVEGTVMRAGNRVRITAQLVRAAADKHLWAEEYESSLSDILKLQGDVGRAISQAIQIRLTPQEQARLAGARPVNPEAYELVLRGRFLWDKRTEADLWKASNYFQKAIDADPTYASAYAGVAHCYVPLLGQGYIPYRQGIPPLRAAATKAQELDDSLAEVHTALGALAHMEWDWARAEREFRRAIELNPSYATAHLWYGNTAEALGRFKEDLYERQRAYEIDPLNMVINGALGTALEFNGQRAQAKAQYLKTLELFPDSAMLLNGLGRFYEQDGQYDAAIAEFKKAGLRYALAHAYAVSGKRAEAQRILEEMKRIARQKYVPPFQFAIVYAGLGEDDQAFRWLEQAYKEHDNFLYGLKIDSRLDSLRPDPRFQDLLRRMNFPP
jgi:TolB-like protein/DNA-binding winged helix-turn-helix (wHTH) protein/Tfp pilus assembly protein PilF